MVRQPETCRALEWQSHGPAPNTPVLLLAFRRWQVYKPLDFTITPEESPMNSLAIGAIVIIVLLIIAWIVIRRK